MIGLPPILEGLAVRKAWLMDDRYSDVGCSPESFELKFAPTADRRRSETDSRPVRVELREDRLGARTGD